MANTSKSTKKPARRAATTSSGSRNAGNRGTNSRTKTSAKNTSEESDEEYGGTTNTTTSQGRTGVDTNDEDHRNARYRGMTNDGEEGDLGSNRSRLQDDEDIRGNRGRGHYDEDEGSRWQGRNRRNESWDMDDNQWSEGRNQSYPNQQYSGRRFDSQYEDDRRGNGYRQRPMQYDDMGMSRDRGYGYNQQTGYQREWQGGRGREMDDFGVDRRQQYGYQRDRSYDQDRYSDDDRGYTRQDRQYRDDLSGVRTQQPGRDDWYGSHQGRNTYDDDWRMDDRDSGRSWRSGQQGISEYDDDRRQRYQGNDMNRGSQRFQGRSMYNEERGFSSNRGDEGSDWNSTQYRDRDDYGDRRRDWGQGRDRWDRGYEEDRNRRFRG